MYSFVKRRSYDLIVLGNVSEYARLNTHPSKTCRHTDDFMLVLYTYSYVASTISTYSCVE